MIGVVILNWRNAEDTVALLTNLRRDWQNDIRIYVVDNHSGGDDVEIIRRRLWEGAELIIHSHNAGYADGNAVGVTAARRSGCTAIVILNNDTMASCSDLRRLADYLSARPRVGIVGPKIVHSDGRIYSRGGTVNTWLSIYRDRRTEETGPVGMLSGAALCLRAELLDSVGFMDGAYFLYWEEADYCFRVRHRGWEVHFLPTVTITHHGARSTRHLSGAYVYYMVRNQLRYHQKNAAWYTWPLFVPVFLIRTVGGYIYLSLRRRRPSNIRFIGRALLDWSLQRFGPIGRPAQN